ncbi:MAG: HAD family hydrolase [candidate division KSB1 bacterium]|nr:HAD family hydrolase [candidate division KSB1 bacterium]MDZ7334073.1 HAD family hydrolase [candidate division KSB1 bacterium]MDZ7357086.1 HAD family hydrolase [candidate division KSB1 bacterium]MDZ7399561.1 HAD family hydrolase [candidate division KSB1 bacterium]
MNISDYIQQLSFEIKALLFDWGNTVMKVFPDQRGPMASWPAVAAMDGVLEVLPKLKRQFRIVLVSDAQDSDRVQVIRALNRVNLDEFFEEIFTPAELYVRKPAPDFYQNVLKQLAVAPENAVMIGDDYEKDIIAAKQVGLWTVWYNPNRCSLPNGSYPYHDIEIFQLNELAAIIQPRMRFQSNSGE